MDAKGQHVAGGRRKDDSIPPLYHRNITPENVDSLIEEKLVMLALEGPQYSQTGHQINISQDNLMKARRAWLNLLSISANYNDQTFAKTLPAQGGYIYPKYFFGLTIPIGLFFTMGPDIKSAKEGVANSRNAQEQMARTIRADVLTKYTQYKTYGALIGLQNTTVDDEQAALKQVEKKFKDGTISIEQYNTASKIYSDDVARKLNLQLQQDLVRIDLEKMIGTRLENVTNSFR
jgi:outer membrane protein TolC